MSRADTLVRPYERGCDEMSFTSNVYKWMYALVRDVERPELKNAYEINGYLCASDGSVEDAGVAGDTPGLSR